MVKYSAKEENPATSVKARGDNLRVHFKHCREVTHFIKGMELQKAKKYLQDVLEYKRGIPFTKFTGGCGRHAQGKLIKAAGNCVRWPQKATKHVLDLLKSAESNAETKTLDTKKLYIEHATANKAPYMRRRTYRAHGRINAYMSSPAHIELILVQKDDAVPKPTDKPAPKPLSRKRAAQLRLKAGGGTD